MRYRREIDGLRAIAVLPVILFHAGFQAFGGGFVGVDVFFVISGYLITTIIIADLERGKFSVLGFYERRARRILPALFFVLICSAFIAWFYLSPVDMKGFSKNLTAVLLFLSNVSLLRETGYFDTASELKPLLHTWSLAIEEQYYLFFPFVMLASWQLGKRWLIFSLTALLLLSFGLAQWLSALKPDQAFYLLPTRGWELLLGAYVAYVLQKSKDVHFPRGVSELAGAFGLALICYAMFTYTSETPFPGVYALIPTFGAVLVIIFATEKTTVGRFVGNRIFVSLGLMSYSAYLWHQPLFAFTRHGLHATPSSELMLGLCLVSLALAFGTFQYVERPFRDRDLVNKKTFLAIGILVFLSLMSFGIAGQKTDGFVKWMLDYKYPAERTEVYRKIFEAINYDLDKNMQAKPCHIWVRDTKDLNPEHFVDCSVKHGKALVLLGDSHAMNLYNIISKNGSFPFLLGVAQGGCRPHQNNSSCHYRNFLDFLKVHSRVVDTVLYHQSGSYFIKDRSGKVDSQSAFEGKFSTFSIENIMKTLDYLEGMSENFSVTVKWIGPFLEFRRDPRALIGSEDFSLNTNSLRLFEELELVLIQALSGSKNVQYVGFSEVFFEPHKPFVAGCFVFRDADHYSKCGEDVIASMSSINQIAAPSRQ